MTEGFDGRGTVTLTINGVDHEVPENVSVAYALLHCGVKNVRVVDRQETDSGVFCGMGSCFECVLTIDGVTSERSCIAVVRDGMRVTVHNGGNANA